MKEKVQPICEHCGWDERRENASHQLPIGTVLKDQYRIGRALGQGGFGITYLGWDLYLDMPVAIKEYYPSSTVMRDSAASLSVASYGGEIGARFRNCKERFLREAKMLARLSEVPEIVKIRNFFESNNTAYIVMEYVRGVTLKDYVKSKGGRLSIEETLAILDPIMEGLCKVHKAGLVHRDISPDNIMLLPEGGAKLIDFGAVRDVGQADKEAPLTKSTEAILKQGYAPIEQYQNRGSLGPWTDVYALCATIYYCITGQVPLDAPGRMLDDEGLQIRKLAPGLSEAYERVLEHGMALRTVNRISSMDELLQMLRNPDPVVEEEPKVVVADPPKEKKRKSRLPLIICLLLAAIGILFLFLKESSEPVMAEPPSQAVPNAQTSTDPVPTVPAVADRWEENVMQNYFPYLNKNSVRRIAFLDSVYTAPADAWDASEAQDGRVLAWLNSDGSLYIAGNGGVCAPVSCSSLFSDFPALQGIHFGDAFHTDFSTDAQNMFRNCPSLKTLDLSSLDTSNVTNMSGMFSGCHGLESLNVSPLNTDKVTDMSRMFENCSSLTELNLKRFSTSHVANMSNMFRGCAQLKSLDLSRFITDYVTDMSGMFAECCSLTELNLSQLDGLQVTSTESMFECCCSLTELDLTNVRFRADNCRRMFADCTNLRDLNLDDSYLFHPNVDTDYTDIIVGCPHLALVADSDGWLHIKSK